ncbi:MAG: flagellar biosynthetic protein FliR [Pseudobacteriovorax sp.]|nr:flagellar biosynthetic protein FliR [Pseudobacteriovorax sp.]
MFNLSYDSALIGFLIFIRISGILFTLPIFGDEPTPVRVRVLLSVGLSIVIFPIVMPEWMDALPKSGLELLFIVLKELFIGLSIGFISRLFFDGIVMAASLVGYQMGFGIANLLIPDANIQMNSFTAMHRIFLMLIFLVLNFHHTYVEVLVDSFRLIPCGMPELKGGLGELFIYATASVFTVSVQLSAPVLVALMFTMAALGLIARAVPQINIFTMSFPTSFFIGLLVYVASLPYFPEIVKTKFVENSRDIGSAIGWMTP